MVPRLKKIFGEIGLKTSDDVKSEGHAVPNDRGGDCPYKTSGVPYSLYFQILVNVEKDVAKKILSDIRRSNFTLYCYLKIKLVLCRLESCYCVTDINK